jgi:drug/metabolite transporter (DMT)-like permease
MTHPGAPAARRRRPLVGYAMVLGGATLFALNGSVVKVILGESGISTLRLTELRTVGATLVLLVVVAALPGGRLRIRRDEIPFFLLYGVCCFVLVQWLYFVAIERLPIGIAVLIQFTAPVLVALWAMLVQHRPVRRTIWAALVLSLVGIALLAQIWDGFGLDALGVTAAAGAAFALAGYFLLGEHAVSRRDPVSLLAIALLFASVFWAFTQPFWSFPFDVISGAASLGGHLETVSLPLWALVAWMVVMGTVAPFVLSVGALRHLPATHVALLAMLEPIVAGFIAWVWLEEALVATQLVGVAVTLIGIGVAQSARERRPAAADDRSGLP